MTREETIKILAILKAAYPNSYKNMTREEANGTVAVWTTQFSDMPSELVILAINRLIGESLFPPAICEVRQTIKGIYNEARITLRENEYTQSLDSQTIEQLNRIIEMCNTVHINGGFAPSLVDMLKGDNQKLLNS